MLAHTIQITRLDLQEDELEPVYNMNLHHYSVHKQCMIVRKRRYGGACEVCYGYHSTVSLFHLLQYHIIM